MSFNLSQSHLAYKGYSLKKWQPLSPRVGFSLDVKKTRDINRTCAFNSLRRFFKIQTLLANYCSLPLLVHQPYVARPRQMSDSRRG